MRPEAQVEPQPGQDDCLVLGWMQCHKCKGYGHLRGMCTSSFNLKLEPWRNQDAAQNAPAQAEAVASITPTPPVVPAAAPPQQAAVGNQNNSLPQQSGHKLKKKQRGRIREAIQRQEKESPRHSSSAEEGDDQQEQVQITRMGLRRDVGAPSLLDFPSSLYYLKRIYSVKTSLRVKL
jgi:hypothetical protein